MKPIPPSPSPEKKHDKAACKHPRVQIVAREDDAEFVECMECGDIFESSEFRDMTIEETKLSDES
jgi:Zn ribbon nucleic-acid-binding protein